MVKNNTGGNKGKKVARKNATTSQEPKRNTEVRRVSDENEMYAAVTKIFSAKRCMATGTDGKEYSCNIRGKFLKGRRSGEGTIGIGVWVIIGFYEWEVKIGGSRGCDILEIYTSNERDILKQIEMHNVSTIIQVGEAKEFNKDCTFSKFAQTTDTITGDNDNTVSMQPYLGELSDVDDLEGGLVDDLEGGLVDDVNDDYTTNVNGTFSDTENEGNVDNNVNIQVSNKKTEPDAIKIPQIVSLINVDDI